MQIYQKICRPNTAKYIICYTNLNSFGFALGILETAAYRSSILAYIFECFLHWFTCIFLFSGTPSLFPSYLLNPTQYLHKIQKQQKYFYLSNLGKISELTLEFHAIALERRYIFPLGGIFWRAHVKYANLEIIWTSCYWY